VRKVIYKEWIQGVETEEYKNATVKERVIFPSNHRFVEGTNCNIEKEGLFHGFFPTTIENNDGTFGNFTTALVEVEDGQIVSLDPEHISFIDSPEDEQLAEFAKAAIQGLCSSFVNDEADRDEYNYAAMSVMIAKATISELKKHKP
jgi:hypothetical protein